MLCPHCGFNIPENSPKFCPKCGKTIVQIDTEKTQYLFTEQHRNPVVQTQTASTSPQNIGNDEANKGKKGKGGKAVITALLALILIAFGILITLILTGVIDFKGNSEEEASSDTVTTEITTEEETTEAETTEEETTEPEKVSMDTVELAAYLQERTVTVHTDVGTGSGFYIDGNGTLVTCFHVIDGASAIVVESATGEMYNVEKVLGFNWLQDIAVLEIDIENSLYLEKPEEPVKTGAKVYALGSSLGDYHNSFSEGVVASDSRLFSGVDCIQMTTAISPGNSGGPLVNEYGEIVGINAFQRTDGNSINFAVKFRYVEELDKTRDFTVSEYADWYVAENEISFYFYDYTNGYFTPSLINTYGTITGAVCEASFYDWESEEIYEGYDPEMGIFMYAYEEEEVNKYIDYIKALGFEYIEGENRDGIKNYYYANDRFGLCLDILEAPEDGYIIIEPFIP